MAAPDRIRRDRVRPGDVIRSSHGYNLLITEVQDTATVRTDERHVGFVGHLHGDPARELRTERYPAGSTVERIARACDQRCGAPATVYAMGRGAGDWGGFYCEPCAHALRFVITDRLTPKGTA